MASMSLWQTTAVAPAATTASAAAAPPANAARTAETGGLQSDLLGRPSEAGPPPRARPGLGRPAQEHESPVPQRREVIHDLPGAD